MHHDNCDFLCISDAYNKYKDSASENTPPISFNDYCEKDPEFNEINKKDRIPS